MSSFEYKCECGKKYIVDTYITDCSLVEEKFTSTNTGSSELLDKMEQFAVECACAGNRRDAHEVRSWIEQLRAGA